MGDGRVHGVPEAMANAGADAGVDAKERAVLRAVCGVDDHGAPMECITLRNASGAELEFLTLGGIIRAIRVPDRHGQLANVVLGFDDPAEYRHDTLYLGALVGRYANRLAFGRFTLDGQQHQIAVNDGEHALHGGREGFHARLWQVDTFVEDHAVGATLRLTSPDGDQGFPGALDATVTYRWRDDHALVVDYHGTTTAPTPVSLTQHSYFNLSGAAASTILAHELTIHASRFTPVDEALIPTGELEPVDGTPFDFRFPRTIGERLGERDPQLEIGAGYDHNWALDHASGARVEAARLYDPASGRLLVLSTTEPGLQVYSGNHLGAQRSGEGGTPLVQYGGVALETQRFPDSPNQPAFPSSIVRPGVPYRSSTVFAFSAVP